MLAFVSGCSVLSKVCAASGTLFEQYAPVFRQERIFSTNRANAPFSWHPHQTNLQRVIKQACGSRIVSVSGFRVVPEGCRPAE